MKDTAKISIIGLGYVGLPLAVEFGKIYKTIGFDINQARIKELNQGFDKTLEVSEKELLQSKFLSFTHDKKEIMNSNIYIITVPTPIDSLKNPDLEPLVGSSKLVGSVIKKGDTVIYESTVYPGATEEICIPILEESSNLKLNLDFSVGYSPERINPGDFTRRLTDITKVTSGSNAKASKFIDKLYKSIIPAGTHQADSIKVAEAAKVIENTQRDVNIALINELAIIFNKLDIDTESVLEAAGTKWNFLKFRPGLVGGHCIGVDPYYLTYKSKSIGYNPEIILAGRKLNDSMGNYVAGQMKLLFQSSEIDILNSRILVLGFSFKEDCPDHRNTKVIDLINSLENYGADVDCYDPVVDKTEVQNTYNLKIIDEINKNYYDGILVAVAHSYFIKIGVEEIKSYAKKNHVLFDLKSIFSIEDSHGRL